MRTAATLSLTAQGRLRRPTPLRAQATLTVTAHALAPRGLSARLHVIRDRLTDAVLQQALNVWVQTAPPGLHLAVHLDVFKGPSRLLDTTLSLRRQPLDGRSMAGVLLRFPLMTLKVIAAIHWEALRLLLKRIPLFPHPPNSGKPTEN